MEGETQKEEKGRATWLRVLKKIRGAANGAGRGGESLVVVANQAQRVCVVRTGNESKTPPPTRTH